MTAIAAPRFWSSTIGKKVVMAITGIILFGYTIGHMLGNLQVYKGPAKLNGYAAALKSMPALLWGVRLLLLTSVILHAWVATQLSGMNGEARRFKYSYRRWRVASYSSRTMMVSGPIVGLFVIYHLLHFTVGTMHPTYPNFNPHDVYRNFVIGFKVVPVSIAYMVANLALGMHLWHGAYSASQTLGLRNPRYAHLLKGLAVTLTLAVTLGNLSFPVAVLAGVVK